MPVFNAAAYIKAALESVASQTFSNYELLVLDACSADDTCSIVKRYQLKDKRIRLVSEKDKGIYDAMNKGVALAKADWLYFMGSDDGFYNRHVLQDISVFLSQENDLVYGDVLWVPDEIKEEGEWTHRKLLKQNINHQRIFYRKSLFEQYGGYQLQYRIAADHELNVRFFCNAAVRKLHIPLLIARYHAGGFSANKIDEVFWNDWDTIILKNFKPWLPAKEIYARLGWYCWYNIEQRHFGKAAALFLKVYLHTFSFNFVKISIAQLLKEFGLRKF